MSKVKEEIVITAQIRDVVGYEFLGTIYSTRLEAKKAEARNELKKLYPRNDCIPYHYMPNEENIVNEYEKVIEILSKIGKE